MTLDEFLSRAAAERRTVSVYGEEEAVADWFATRNVVVEHEALPDGETAGFAVIQDEDGFAAAVGLSTFEELTTPPIPGAADLGEERAPNGFRELLRVLDDTLFGSLERRQLLATSREIEDRVYRTGEGTLHVGFQNFDRARAQRPVYERLAADTTVDIHVYGRPGENGKFASVPGVTPHTSTEGAAAEIGRFWFLVFDGGGADNECALLGEERAPGSYYGFWTYDPGLVGELLDYLEATYG